MSQKNLIPLFIKDRYLLTKKGSTKETFHITFNRKDSSYKVGDAIAIFPENAIEEVEEVLALLPFSPNALITHPKNQQQYTLQNFLQKQANLRKIRLSLLVAICARIKHSFLQELLQQDNKERLSLLLQDWGLADFLRHIPMPLSEQEFLSHLLPLLPRFYSIASSPLVFPNEMHITVACFSYLQGTTLREGIASRFLCHAATSTTSIFGYIQPNKDFTLPTDPAKNIIMVGSGTGIAPYKGFLEERTHTKAAGKSWLFFGERNEQYDFFYQDFFQACVERGNLILDVAFSRDQKEKIYVQHKIEQQAKEIFRWLEEGSTLYICGDAKRMARDVESTLCSLIAKERICSAQESYLYIKELRREKRYLLDVY